jgi:hypothetical protein
VAAVRRAGDPAGVGGLRSNAVPRPAGGPQRLTPSPARFSDLAGWSDDHVAAVLPAFLKSCAQLASQAAGAPLDPSATERPGSAGSRIGGRCARPRGRCRRTTMQGRGPSSKRISPRRWPAMAATAVVTLDTNRAGAHTVLYCATGRSGLSACATRTVNVVSAVSNTATTTNATSTSG